MRELAPRPCDRQPTPINQSNPSVRTIQGRQHLVSRPALVSSVIQEKLVFGVELPNDGHPLESPHGVDPACIERNGLIGTAGKLGPLRLARVAAGPLPEPERDEHHAQHHGAQCEKPRGRESAPAGIAQYVAAYTLSRMQYLLRPLVFCLLIAI